MLPPWMARFGGQVLKIPPTPLKWMAVVTVNV